MERRSMRPTRRSLAVLAAALSVAAALGAGHPAALAQDRPVTLRFSSNAPPKSPWAVQVNRLAEAVAQESKGSLKIEPFFGGQLGNEQDTIQQIARGRIDMGMFAIGAVSLLAPELQLPILPLYFSSLAESDCVMDRHLVKPIGELLAAKGVTLLGVGDVGQIDLAGKKAYPNAQDVKGIKAVTYSKNQSMMWTALGANSTFVGVPEWSSALQSGLVDVAGAPMALYVPGGINKVAPVLTQLNLWSTPALIVINKGIHEKLSAEQQAAFARAMAVENAAKLRGEIRAMEAKLREAHVAGGGQIVTVTAEQREGWRRVVAPAWPEMVKSMGGQAEQLFRTIEAARATCKG
jgi:TRAP-type C4-dicarboxylate transport system substrate-binding protein